MSIDCVISGTGLFTPAQVIPNADLVASLNRHVELFNTRHAEAIAAGQVERREPSSTEFVEKASGIKSRYVMDRDGVLDPERMYPRLPMRPFDQLSIQAEMALAAIRPALAKAGREPKEVDGILVACSNMQRAYPAMAIEIQEALGAGGFGYDLNVACSSATFGIQAAVDAVANGSADCVVVVSPEITSGHNNFTLRDSHFIFGDAATAVVVERADRARSAEPWAILGTRLQTKFSMNIRNLFGFLNRSETPARGERDVLFQQNGRQVFKEVCPMVADHILDHLRRRELGAAEVKRLWLHQANLSMNQFIAKRVLGREASDREAPVILDEYANTSSAGSVIAFHKHKNDLALGDLGIICSFGAGYSIGSVIVRKLAA